MNNRNISRDNANPHSNSGNYPSVNRAKFLRELYTAYTAELESISDCLYYGLILSEYDPDMSEILENIAIDDMKHIKKMGQLLMTLGANPAINTKFRAGGANMFPSAEDKRTDSMASSVADYLIAQKSAAVDKYSNILKDAPDISIMNIINSITSDEQKHRHMLMNYCMYI